MTAFTLFRMLGGEHTCRCPRTTLVALRVDVPGFERRHRFQLSLCIPGFGLVSIQYQLVKGERSVKNL